MNQPKQCIRSVRSICQIPILIIALANLAFSNVDAQVASQPPSGYSSLPPVWGAESYQNGNPRNSQCLPGLCGRPVVQQTKTSQLIASSQKGNCWGGSVHWQAPLSYVIEKDFHLSQTHTTCKSRFRDHLDEFAHIRLMPNVRCDSGYHGCECDPFGYPSYYFTPINQPSRTTAMHPQPHNAK